MGTKRISIFPLGGAILLPDMQLPLHIFEPRYRALVGDALARDRMIGMIQPMGGGDNPSLFAVGCLGRIGERAALEAEARRFADAQGYAVDWNAVSQLDDFSLVNVIAQIAPFDVAAKQALLESKGLAARNELVIQLMQFFGRQDGFDDRMTLQ